MENLTKLLEGLSVKLGTTVDHLWEVLIKQAPISGAVDLFLCIVLMACSVLAFKFVARKTKVDWEDEGAFFAWLFVAVISVISFIRINACLEKIVAAFYNPEYWALMKVLGKIKC